MKNLFKVMVPLCIVGMIMTGCYEKNVSEVGKTLETTLDKELEKALEKPTLDKTKVVTLTIGEKLSNSHYVIFQFNGFVGEDTLAFRKKGEYGDSVYYQPAKIGHKFSIIEFESIQFEVLEFSREKGYVTLKAENIEK